MGLTAVRLPWAWCRRELLGVGACVGLGGGRVEWCCLERLGLSSGKLEAGVEQRGSTAHALRSIQATRRVGARNVEGLAG